MVSSPAGHLYVTVESARGLQLRQLSDRQNAYFIASVGSQVFRSPASVRSGTEPVWKETVQFYVTNEPVLNLEIRDEHTHLYFYHSCRVARAAIPLASVRQTGVDHILAPLLTQRSAGGRVQLRGDVFVTLSWVPTPPRAATPSGAVGAIPWVPTRPRDATPSGAANASADTRGSSSNCCGVGDGTCNAVSGSSSQLQPQPRPQLQVASDTAATAKPEGFLPGRQIISISAPSLWLTPVGPDATAAESEPPGAPRSSCSGQPCGSVGVSSPAGGPEAGLQEGAAPVYRYCPPVVFFKRSGSREGEASQLCVGSGSSGLVGSFVAPLRIRVRAVRAVGKGLARAVRGQGGPGAVGFEDKGQGDKEQGTGVAGSPARVATRPSNVPPQQPSA